jgi:uncharacterized membrane-anchored protein YhcB (DUF1043 family)
MKQNKDMDKFRQITLIIGLVIAVVIGFGASKCSTDKINNLQEQVDKLEKKRLHEIDSLKKDLKTKTDSIRVYEVHTKKFDSLVLLTQSHRDKVAVERAKRKAAEARSIDQLTDSQLTRIILKYYGHD